MSSIPEDVCLDILARLPVKSLLRCKCVCKSWFQIISNPGFVKMHRDVTIQKKNPGLMFYNIDNRSKYLEICTIGYDSLYSSLELRDIHDIAVTNDFPDETLFNDIWLCGYCNGLVYFWSINRRKFCVWSPATKNYKIIPIPQKNLYNFLGLCGFGYDCKIDDYKVIILWNLYSPNHEDRCLVDVYTLRKDSWKSSNIELDMVPWRQEIGVLVHGALHWSGKWRDKRSKLIISLDISDEKFKQIELPEGDLENSDFWMTLGALEGSLCVLEGVNMVKLEVWVMQDYGVRESWTKRYTITHEKLIKFSFNVSDVSLHVKLMGSFKNGEILFWTDGKLVLYDPKHSSARVLAYCWIHVLNAVNYFESLVSVNSCTYVGGKSRTKM